MDSSLTNYVPIISVIGYSLAIFGVINILRRRLPPSTMLAWLLVLILLPYLGLIAYFILGFKKNRRRTMLNAENPKLDKNRPIQHTNSLTELLASYHINDPSSFEKFLFCGDGKQAFDELISLIRKAQKYICVEMFIFADDETGITILEELTSRAKAGCTVRLLIDGIGSLKTPRSFFEPFIEAGGDLSVFEPPLHPLFGKIGHGSLNLRNHRKLVIVDGSSLFAGGMNVTVSDIYCNEDERSWLDCSFFIEGDIVTEFEQVFEADWCYPDVYDRPSINVNDKSKENACVQLLPSGPDVAGNPLYAATLTCIHRSESRIWLVTPYFVPDEAIARALEYACRRGVDVRILIPHKSNHPVSDWAGSVYLRDIQNAGGVIYRHSRMVHSKMMIIDEDYAFVGSANMDIRSLFLNYELMLVFYSENEIRTISHWFDKTMQDCEEGLAEAGVFRQIGEGLLRTFAPIL